MKRRRLLEALALTLLIQLSSLLTVGRAEAADQAKDQASKLVLRGRIVCLDPAGAARAQCNEGDRFALLAGGKLYTFLAEDAATGMFTDSRVRERELQITALARSRDQMEIIKVHSLKQGKLYDIYYFCEVCNITAYVPGPCTCCREEMELKETPAPNH
jgi:hypothetical protein